MERKYDRRVVAHGQGTDYYHSAKPIRDEKINEDGIIEDKNGMLLQLRAFSLSSSMRLMKKFILVIDGFEDDEV